MEVLLHALTPLPWLGQFFGLGAVFIAGGLAFQLANRPSRDDDAP
jgi:hypothetical protein